MSAISLAAMSDDELRTAAQGCSELTCPVHGSYNRELDRRATLAHSPTPKDDHDR